MNDLYGYMMGGLEACRGRWPEIADDTAIPYSTIAKIAQRQIENPGINKVQPLANWLKSHEREWKQRAA